MNDKHGTELVDDITARIDAALDGYEGQTSSEGAMIIIRPRPPTDKDVGEAFSQFGNVLERIAEGVSAAFDLIAEQMAPLLDLVGSDTAPTNDFRDRWDDWHWHGSQFWVSIDGSEIDGASHPFLPRPPQPNNPRPPEPADRPPPRPPPSNDAGFDR